jgi:hypothetical protein
MKMRHWDWKLIIPIVAIVIMGCVGITMSIRQSTAFSNDCIAAGGHVIDTHGRGFSKMCASEDGRIINIGLR